MTTDKRAPEAGFTLIELLITLVIMVVVMTAITFTTVTALGITDKSQNRLLQSHDAQLVSFYLISDMNSVDSGKIFTDPTRAMPAACTTGGVPVATTASPNLLQLQWTDKGLTSSNMYAVTYRAELVGSGPRYQIVRYFCSGTGSVTKFVVVHNLKSAVQCPTANFAVCVTPPNAGSTKIGMKLTTSIGGVDHVFTVTANGRTPSAAAGAPAPLSAALFELAAASTSPMAGATNDLTITAKDSAGNIATSYSGGKALTFRGPTAVGANAPGITNNTGTVIAFEAPTNITFTNGVATVSAGSNGVMTLYKAETVRVVVTDGTINNGTGLSVTVSAGPAARLVLAAQTTSPIAGSADRLTVSAVDTYGNAATSYTGDKGLTFSGPGSSVALNDPTVEDKDGTAKVMGTATPISFTNGVASVTGGKNGVMTLYKAETVRVVVTDGTINNGTGLSVIVSAAPAARFVLTALTTTPTAGSPNNLTVSAFDAYGNSATSYTGDKRLTFSGPGSSAGLNAPTVADKDGNAIGLGTATTITFTNGVASVSPGRNGVITLYKAETVNIVVTDMTINNGAGLSVTVNAAAAVLSFWNDTGSAPFQCSSFDTKKGNARDNGKTTVRVRRDKDQYGNTTTVFPSESAPTITLSGSNGGWTPATLRVLDPGVMTTDPVTWQNSATSVGQKAVPTASADGYAAASCSYTITN